MITLENNSTNNIVLTLNEAFEKTANSPSYFIFKFTNKQTLTEHVFICDVNDDLSSDKVRYNEFEVELGVDDPINSKIDGLDEGQYIYEVWLGLGTIPATQSSIVIPSDTYLAEKGRVLIK